MPFREAHGVVGDLVRRALDDGQRLSDIPPDDLSKFSELLDDEYYEVLTTESALDAKRSAGGTSPAALSEQLAKARAALAEATA
jgi:argininosuccinate lyase